MDVVFVSSSAEYAVEGYEAYPLNYLLKPITQERLAGVIDRFLEWRTPRILRLSTSKGVLRLATADVLFFEIFDHDVVIHKANGTSEFLTGSLKEMEYALPARSFVRPHRSYLVNLEHVTGISRFQLRLSSGDLIPISKNLYPKVQASLIEYDDRRSVFR